MYAWKLESILKKANLVPRPSTAKWLQGKIWVRDCKKAKTCYLEYVD